MRHGNRTTTGIGLALVALCMVLPVNGSIIKIGNVLDISVVDHPGYSGRYTVNESGTIDYPLLADEVIVNISTSELMNHLAFRLAKHVDNPLVLISVVEKPDIEVVVLGQVEKPGPVTTYSGASLQEVLALAGGPTSRADLTRVKIVGAGMSDNQARYFDLIAFMRAGNVDALPRLQADDIIILTSTEKTSRVKVIGGVREPGFFDVEERMNMFEVIYLAGGPAEKADLSRVRRFFTVDGKTMEEVIDIQDFIDKGEMDKIPMVNPGDVIIVYTRWFDWRTLMAILNNTLLFIVTLQAFSGIFN